MSYQKRNERHTCILCWCHTTNSSKYNSGYNSKASLSGENQSPHRRLVQDHFPEFLELYDGYPKENFRADFARAAYMYIYGGVYADTDVISVQPMDSLLAQFDSYGVLLGAMGKLEDIFRYIDACSQPCLPQTRKPIYKPRSQF